MRERQPRTHAYAWHTTPRPFPEFRVPRICVDISQEPTYMRGSHQQGHFYESRSHAYAWTRVTPRICVTYITKAMFTFKSPHIGVDISQQLTHMHESGASKSATLTPKYSTYAWSSSQPTHASELPHAYAPVVKLMHGQACRVTPCVAQLSKKQQSSRICVNII
ncbi:hypothetical protein PIB30_100577 [Stylosanthes scabra]|uniref:Uncharacterized protein n=1 Tax=Stylosanthes scabra TaxID=79078 RepID=A0ABU6SYQ7_9FABA|nr:hypothetical protein [Stylosanthes scabra]